MSTAIAQQFLTLLQVENTPAAADLLHDDVVWHQPGSTPVSGRQAGKGAVIQLLMSFAQLGIRLELVEAYRYGEETLCRIEIHHEIGKRSEFQTIGLNGERISSIRHYGDTDYLAQIFLTTLTAKSKKEFSQ